MIAVAGCWTIQPTGAAYGAPSEIQISAADSANDITPKIIAAFEDHHLPVTSSQGGLIEAKLPQKTEFAGRFEISAHAVVLPFEHGVHIRLYADQTAIKNLLGNGTHRVTPVSDGRALETWNALVAAAKEIQPDSTKIRIVAAGDTP